MPYELLGRRRGSFKRKRRVQYELGKKTRGILSTRLGGLCLISKIVYD